MKKRKPIKFLTCLLLVVSFTSCKQKPIQYEYKQQIIKSKTVDLKDGNTRYNIAFTDGSSEAFSFGIYSKYEIGDTICWKREKNWIWYIVDCK